MEILKLRKPTLDEIEQTKHYLHTIFRQKFFHGFKGFKRTHTMNNCHLVNVGDVWYSITPMTDPISYKILEERNLKGFFNYLLHLQLQSTTQKHKELQIQLDNFNIARQGANRHRISLEQKKLTALRDEWNLTYQTMHVAYVSIVASIEQHLSEEVKYLKKYLRKQRKKSNTYKNFHKQFMKAVRHELYLYHL